MIQLKPVWVALRKHKAGAILIALQIALAFAVVCNALFVIDQRLLRISRPTGIDENNLLVIQNNWVGVEGAATIPLVQADLQVLRQLPGVADVSLSSAYPLRGGGWISGVRIDPAAKDDITLANRFFTDDHLIATLGAKLIAGRNFRSDEITAADRNAMPTPAVVIITKALADKLYPHGSALGKPVFISDTAPSTVIGILERMQGGRIGGGDDLYAENTTLLPFRLVNYSNNYLIRTKPGQLQAVLKTAPEALRKLNRMRYFPPKRGIRSFATVRAQAYAKDRGMAELMVVICAVLLAITAAGIVGLTSFWVGQRRKQIGVRRALGARRRDILEYFLTENLLIAGAGALLGMVLAVAINFWLVMHFEMARLPLAYVFAATVLVLALGQSAVFVPARRASQVPPVVATRTV